MKNEKSSVLVKIIVPEGETDDILNDVKLNGGKKTQEPTHYELPIEFSDLFGDQQFEPLTIIAVSLSLGFLIQRIGRVWREMSHPKGVIIDTRKTPFHVIETKSLDPGEVLILRENSTESFGMDKKDEAIDAIKKIWGG